MKTRIINEKKQEIYKIKKMQCNITRIIKTMSGVSQYTAHFFWALPLWLISTVFNACQQGASVNSLCCGYQYVDRGGRLNSIVKSGTLTDGILSDIIQFEHNSAFILVLQRPNYDYHRMDLAVDIRRRDKGKVKRSESSLQTVYESMAYSVLSNDPKYQKIFSKSYNLWIITRDDIFGPLDLESYLKKRRELDVPAGLQLKF